MAHIGPHVQASEASYIHPTATLHGKVTLARGASIWANAVTRAEMYEIRIGAYTNIQDFAMLHVGARTPTLVGERCSITHHVTLHGCDIGDNCLIGINAVIMDGATIGANSIVAGNSLVKEGASFPPNSIIAGSPAKLVKERDNREANVFNAAFYYQNALNYTTGKDILDEEDIARAQQMAQDWLEKIA